MWEALFIAGMVLYLIILDIDSITSYNRLRHESRSLQDACVHLAQVNQRQRQYLDERSSAQNEDRWIRTELGYVKPGEIAVVFLKGSHEH